MAPDSGRHAADDNASDRARIDYLAGVADFVDPTSVGATTAGADPAESELSAADRAELDALRELLADPTLWAEPPAELEDSVVALITAEATGGSSTGNRGEQFPFVSSTATEPDADQARALPPSVPNGQADLAGGPPPIDLAAARQAKQQRTGRRRFTRPVFLVAAAAAVVTIALTAVVVLRDSTPQRRFDVALAATELVPAATGNATMLKTTSGWEIQLDASGLPRLDGGQFYEAWLKNADGVLVPIGTFNEGTDVTLWSGVPPDSFPTMTITRESADGDQASSGQRVLIGTAVEQ